jgi:hypothetical protein
VSKPWNFLFWNKVNTNTISNCFKLTFAETSVFCILCLTLVFFSFCMFVEEYTFQKCDFIASAASENFHNLKHMEAYFCHFSNFYIKPHFLKNTQWKMFWHENKGSDQLIFSFQIYIQLTLLLLCCKKVVSWLPPPVLYTVALYS